MKRVNNLSLIDSSFFRESSEINYVMNHYLNFVSELFPKFLYQVNLDLYDVEKILSQIYFIPALRFLKYSLMMQCRQLIDIVVFDNPGKKYRFVVIYIVQSIKFNNKIKVRLYTNEINPLNSLTKIYENAYWAEREIWDMYGILFEFHSDLRRILTDYGFIGFPLRKDFPLSGYIEVFYSDHVRRLVQKRISLAQVFRVFKYLNPWKAFEIVR